MRSMKMIDLVRLGALVVLSLSLFAGTAAAYPDFGGCSTCHGNFRSGSPSIHDRHTSVVNSCTDCHTSVGDTPKTNSSGNYATYSCNGCHPKGGLATHHVTAGITVCNNCHSGVIGTIAGENVLPYFYTNGRSGVVNTCRRNAANGGEDLDGDGTGLDNDGDGVYDVDDPDCAGIVPVNKSSWSTVKSRYGV
jgi:hypothetical protein